MNRQNALVLWLLGTLTLSPALAQTMPADAMKTGEAMMSAAPTFAYTGDAAMNMMMSGAGVVGIAAAPGEKLVSRSVKGTGATLVYSGKNSAGIFAFYDRAIKAEGWKTTAMDGKMMADAMAKPADTMAGSTMTGGLHSATFALGGHIIDLNVRESAGRVTVAFKSK